MNRLMKWIRGKARSETKPSIEVTLLTAKGVMTGTIRPLSKFEEELLSEVKALKSVLEIAACPNAMVNRGKHSENIGICKWCHKRKVALAMSVL